MRRITIASVAAVVALTFVAHGEYSEERFRNPANIHSPAYFWMWNDRLDAKRLNAQLDDMFAHGMRSICIHPFPKAFRPGKFDSAMEPDYLTEGYFTVFSNVVDHAAALGMNVWLYDEGGWPSGGACGQVAAGDKEGKFRKRFLDPDGKVIAQPYGPGGGNYPSIIENGTTEDFIARTPWTQLQHLVRYLKAITVRLDKYRADPARDAARLKELLPLEQRYTRLLAQRKGQHDARLEEYRWMLQELRVSFFAQELRTPYPVSSKRLDKVWAQLQH